MRRWVTGTKVPWAGLAVGAAFLVVSMLAPGAARAAASYNVFACFGGYGNNAYAVGGTSSFAGEFTPITSCGDPSASFQDTAPTSTASHPGDSSGFYISAPAGLTFGTVQLQGTASFSAEDGWSSGFTDMADGDPYVAGCMGEQITACNATYNQQSFNINGSTVFGPSIRCDAVGGSCANPGTAGFEVGGLTVSVNESGAPTWTQGIDTSNVAPQSSAGGYFSGANAPAKGWSIAPAAQDPSGICDINDQLVNTGSGQIAWSMDSDLAAGAKDFSTTQPCVPARGGITATDAATINPCMSPDGDYTLNVNADNAAGNYSGAPGSGLAFNVDCTAPTMAFANGPDQTKWFNSPQTIDLAATDNLSGVAQINCTINGHTTTYRPGATVTVQPPGGQLSCTALDNAGNASIPADYNVNIDTTPPSGSFQPQDPGAPDTVQVMTADSQSGVAGGIVQVEQGTSWINAVTTYDPSTGLLTAQLPDTKAIADGPHAIRAIVADTAGNTATITTNAAGATETANWPLRTVADLTVGTKAKLRKQCRAVRTPAKKRAHKKHARRSSTRGTRPATRVELARLARLTRRARPLTHTAGHTSAQTGVLKRKCSTVAVPVKRAKLHLGHRQQGRFTGRLDSSDGQPIANAALTVTATPVGHSPAPAGTVTTDAKGHFAYTIPKKGPERTITFAYGGSPTVRPASASVRVIVAGAGTIAVAHATIAPGQKETISGKVEGGYIPTGGKLVQLIEQAPGHDAQPFSKPIHTDAAGRWHVTFTISRNAAHTRFKIRALLERQAGWPWPKTLTRSIEIHVT